MSTVAGDLAAQLADFKRAASVMDATVKKEITDRLGRTVIEPIVREIRQQGSLYGGQSAASTRSVKGTARGFVGRIQAGGGMVVGTQGHPVTAGELIFGAIFGAHRDAYSAYKVRGKDVRRRVNRGFPARNAEGWWFVPEAEREGPKAFATLAEALYEAIGGAFDG